MHFYMNESETSCYLSLVNRSRNNVSVADLLTRRAEINNFFGISYVESDGRFHKVPFLMLVDTVAVFALLFGGLIGLSS